MLFRPCQRAIIVVDPLVTGHRFLFSLVVHVSNEQDGGEQMAQIFTVTLMAARNIPLVREAVSGPCQQF